jgi:hypothetical protein
VLADGSGLYAVDTANRLTRSRDGGATWTPIAGFQWQPLTAFAVSADAVYLGSFVINDMFLTKLDPGGALVYSRLFGGAGYDEATDLLVDSSGAATVAGLTTSWDLPLLESTADFHLGFPADRAAAGGFGALFVSRFDAAGEPVSSITAGVALGFPSPRMGAAPGGLCLASAGDGGGVSDVVLTKIGLP